MAPKLMRSSGELLRGTMLGGLLVAFEPQCCGGGFAGSIGGGLSTVGVSSSGDITVSGFSADRCSMRIGATVLAPGAFAASVITSRRHSRVERRLRSRG